MDEIYKEIDGFNSYLISNLGNIYDKKTGEMLTPFVTPKGYLNIALMNNKGEMKLTIVHRLVAKAFIPNPDNLPQVNHKDENKQNNCVNNLEWVTNSYNAHYGTHYQRVAEANRCCPTTSKRIYSVDKYGNVEYYNSIGEAERQTGLSHCNIVRNLKGRYPICGGRTWHYCTDEIDNESALA